MKVFAEFGPYPNELIEVRLPTEEEKAQHCAGWADGLIFGTGNRAPVPYVKYWDIPAEWKTRDYWALPSCGNRCYEISDEEWDWVVSLNAQREAEKKAKERQEDIEWYQNVIRKAERQPDIPTPEEAASRRKRWNDVYNEGGYGYVPDIIDSARYARAKQRLQELTGGSADCGKQD